MLRQENGRVRNEAAKMEEHLKAELQKSARMVLALREENTQYKDSVETLTARRDTLEKEIKQASGEIASLKKQLAKALSEEEKVQLKRRIADLNEVLRKLAEGSEDELVREAANKNLVIDGLMREHEAFKAEIRRLNKSVETYRVLAAKEHSAAEKAEELAKVAVYDARKTRGELKMLRADIEDGIVKLPESKRPVRRMNADNPPAEVRPQVAKVKVSAVNEPKSPAAVPVAARSVPAERPEASKPAGPRVIPPEYKELMKNGAKAEKDGTLDMALWYYWQAADMMENYAEPYFALAKVHIKRKEMSKALSAYQKALQYGGARNRELEEILEGSRKKNVPGKEIKENRSSRPASAGKNAGGAVKEKPAAGRDE